MCGGESMTDATITPIRPSPAKGEAPKDRTATERKRRSRANKRKRDTVTVTPVTVERHDGRGIVIATTAAALCLATVSAGFSITGMTSIFVGALWPVIGMGVALELGKLSAVACIGRRYGSASLRLALVVLVAVLMGL